MKAALLIACLAMLPACSSCNPGDEQRPIYAATGSGNGCYYVLVCQDMGVQDLSTGPFTCSHATTVAPCGTTTRDGHACYRCTGQQGCTDYTDGGTLYCTQNAVNCYDPHCQ